MQEICGDLWDYHQQGFVVVITTGGQLEKSGACAMPRGCARQARDKFVGLASILGDQILAHGNHVFDLGRRVVSFPVENSPFELPDLRLIERSCRELVELADAKGWAQVVVPRPGCGGGGLVWEEIRPRLAGILDDRFLLICAAGPTNISSGG